MKKTRLPHSENETILIDERGMLDVPYLVLTMMLVGIGLVMLFSASYAWAINYDLPSVYYFIRQAGFAAVGIGFMIFISRVNYQIWRFGSFWVLGISIFFLILVQIPGLGVTRNGATRWINIGFEFQPSEAAKMGMILTFANLMSVYRNKMQTFKYGVLPFGVILGIIAALLILQPHLSATVIFCATGAIMMMLGGTRVRWLIVGVAAAGVLVMVYLKLFGYTSDRIVAWQDPFKYADDKGYQIVQSLYAIGSGGLFGLGFGHSRQKYLYLPEAQNDYIFAIVCEELGIVGAVLIIVLFALLVIRGYWIALHARDRFGALVAAGLTTRLALQVFFNVGVVTNLLPPTGISLPFFSYGGTALMIQLAEMGIVLSISRWNTEKFI